MTTTAAVAHAALEAEATAREAALTFHGKPLIDVLLNSPEIRYGYPDEGLAPTRDQVARVFWALGHMGIGAHLLSKDVACLGNREPFTALRAADRHAVAIASLFKELGNQAFTYPGPTTAAYLDSLPLGSVIIDAGGLSWQVFASHSGENTWVASGDEDGLTSTQLFAHYHANNVPPAITVLWVGEERDIQWAGADL